MRTAAPAGKPKRDPTAARRQAKRRARFNRMQQALRQIEQAASLEQAKAVARDGLLDGDAGTRR